MLRIHVKISKGTHYFVTQGHSKCHSGTFQYFFLQMTNTGHRILFCTYFWGQTPNFLGKMQQKKNRTNNLYHWKAGSILVLFSFYLRLKVHHWQQKKTEQQCLQHGGRQIYAVSCKAFKTMWCLFLIVEKCMDPVIVVIRMFNIPTLI